MSKSKARSKSFNLPNKPIRFPVLPGTSAAPSATEIGSELGQVAKQAFEEKRREDCLVLAHAILKIDPQHKVALMMQSWVRSDLEKELGRARMLLQEGTLQKNRSYGEAEDLLRAILSVNPEFEEAKTLLSEVVLERGEAQSTLPPAPSITLVKQNLYKLQGQAKRFLPNPDRKKQVGAALIVAVLTLAFIGGLKLISKRGETIPVASPSLPSPSILNAAPAPPQPVENSGTPTATPVIPAKPLTPGVRAARTPRPAPPQQALASIVPPEAAPSPSGTLAVNAPIPVDIYMGDQYLGSTPVTLELPSGSQTLEYRYGSLRQTLSHTIESNETTTATVIFDVVVQVNARPWAQVFIEGSEPALLGQTPMSDMRVPAGSVLIFRNPNFPERKHRVSGDEKTIQVIF